MNTLFIIDPTANLKTQAKDYGTMSAPEGMPPTHVDYSGYLYNNKGNNFTLQEYKDYKNNQNLIAITWDEFYKIIEAHEKTLQGKFTEVTEAQYWEALECLPPCKWHDLNSRFNSFYISEAMTGVLHSFYIHDKKTNKYYSALRSKFITDTELLKDLETIN